MTTQTEKNIGFIAWFVKWTIIITIIVPGIIYAIFICFFILMALPVFIKSGHENAQTISTQQSLYDETERKNIFMGCMNHKRPYDFNQTQENYCLNFATEKATKLFKTTH